MADQYTETTTTSYGTRIGGSFAGMAVGLVMFLVSFPVLYWNEGRVDLSRIAKTAFEINSQNVSTDAKLSGKLISTMGVVNTDESLGDDLYLKPQKLIGLVRSVEMFAWIETKESTSKKNVGGSETTETTYTYKKGWTDNPVEPSVFAHPEGHENPQKTIDGTVKRAQDATVGVYHINPVGIALPEFSGLALNSKNVELDAGASLIGDGYIFLRKLPTGTYENPQIGDQRVSYSVLQPGFRGTVFGTQNGNSIDSYVDDDGNRLYRLFDGTRAEGIATLHSEHTLLTWMLRCAGFFLMWFGLMALFGPISTLLDILPMFGTITRGLVGVLTFVVAGVLSSIAILISMFLHSFIAMLIALILAVAGMLFYVVVRKRNKATAATPAATV